VLSNRPRRGLFLRYTAYLAGLVSIALLASGAVGLAFGYRDTRTLVEQLQREKVRSAALRIEQFATAIEAQLRAAVPLLPSVLPNELQALRFDLHRLLRQAPAIAELKWVDATGLQQVEVSRRTRDRIGVAADLASHAGVLAALDGTTHFSAVYFRNGTEPYLTVAVGTGRRAAGVLLAEVNLTFVRDVVLEIGEASARSYVVDSKGRLIAHPDLGLVLRGTDLSDFAPVRTALAGAAGHDVIVAASSADGRARQHLVASASIPSLGWHVFVEQPLADAFAPLYAALARTAALIVLGVVLAVLAGLALARHMATPIAALQRGAARLGAGRLDERVELRTGDELELLADEFNRMAERLRESHAGLEQKIARRTRELAAANQAKSRFLAAASHDLRQPVHALGLYIAQLRDAGNAATRERLLAKVEASSAAVSELIEALLDISKLDAGTVTPQPAAFAAQDLLNRIEDSFAAAAQAKGLRLRVRPSALHIATDPMLLERIVSNLVANAVRYTREGGVLVACRRRAGAARFEVWDTGIGIASAQQQRIFEEFYQLHDADSEASKGLGLGLAIVDRLAALLGLRVTMTSVEGRGSTFRVEAPLATPADAASAAVTVGSPARYEGAVALVIDDDADARDAAAGLLSQWGWRVITADGAAGALAALGATPERLGVIIADYRLGRGELGTQAIEQIRAACGEAVPALVVSGDVTVEMREGARSAGLHLLHKPLQAARLRTLLHHLVQTPMSGEAAA
jgi:signal transduction histidine kinase/CheY-like chemotaxis protein